MPINKETINPSTYEMTTLRIYIEQRKKEEKRIFASIAEKYYV